jgi:hypothetical protein
MSKRQNSSWGYRRAIREARKCRRPSRRVSLLLGVILYPSVELSDRVESPMDLDLVTSIWAPVVCTDFGGSVVGTDTLERLIVNVSAIDAKLLCRLILEFHLSPLQHLGPGGRGRLSDCFARSRCRASLAGRAAA